MVDKIPLDCTDHLTDIDCSCRIDLDTVAATNRSNADSDLDYIVIRQRNLSHTGLLQHTHHIVVTVCSPDCHIDSFDMGSFPQ